MALSTPLGGRADAMTGEGRILDLKTVEPATDIMELRARAWTFAAMACAYEDAGATLPALVPHFALAGGTFRMLANTALVLANTVEGAMQ